jgi:signal transduction histidine kinase
MPDPARRLIKIAHANSARLVRLVNDILDIEKLESGKVVFDLQHVDVQTLVEQALETNRPLAESFGVTLCIEPASARVHADPDRLTQVITNLLSNAIKFSPAGANVVAAIRLRGDRVRISVRDHGPGIPEAFRPYIFNRFAQASLSDAGQMPGSGLGLSIAKQIVVRLGGEVGFIDAAGGGSVFFVDIPRSTVLPSVEDGLEVVPA